MRKIRDCFVAAVFQSYLSLLFTQSDQWGVYTVRWRHHPHRAFGKPHQIRANVVRSSRQAVPTDQSGGRPMRNGCLHVVGVFINRWLFADGREIEVPRSALLEICLNGIDDRSLVLKVSQLALVGRIPTILNSIHNGFLAGLLRTR